METVVSLAFFIYTILLMLVCAYASSISLCSYLVTHATAHLAKTILFGVYLLEQGVAFSWGYSGFPGLSYETEGVIGIALLGIELVLSSVMVGAALWAISETTSSSWQRGVLFPSAAYACLLVIGIVSPLDQDTYQWLAFSLRSLIVAGSLAWSLHARLSSPSETERLATKRHATSLMVIGVLLAATIAFDTFVYLNAATISQIAPESLVRYVCERNLFENALLVYAAGITIAKGSSILSLRFKEPPAGSHSLDEVRLARFAERYHLTPTEQVVAALLIEGRKIRVIANELVVSEGTVKTHLSHIYRKVGCSNRTELLQEFWKRS